MITEKQYLEAKKIIAEYTEQLRVADVMRWQQYQDDTKLLFDKSKVLADKAKENGYTSGAWIISDAFPNTELRIGYGMIWSENQRALVVGCTDSNNSYYTAVPIYKPDTDWWAELVACA
jgi:hypothetical protein